MAALDRFSAAGVGAVKLADRAGRAGGLLFQLNLVRGAVEVEPGLVWEAILDDAPLLSYQSELDYSDRMVQRDATLITEIRLPRAVMACLIGVGLALAGASLQGVFRNALADPSLIGVSSGAAFGAVTGIVLGLDRDIGIPAAAFASGLLTTALIYRLSVRRYRTSGTDLLLIGLGVNAIASAYIGLASFAARESQVGDIVFWAFGSLAGIFWADVYVPFIMVAVGAVVLPWFARAFNLMALGEDEARHLGVDVDFLRLVVISLAAMIVGVGVAYAGVIGFVGLVVPHLVRLLVGPDYRVVLPASALGGAVFLLAADLAARTFVSLTEVPLGMITTLVGGPMFVLLILFSRQR
ncbi:MAG: iron ABC transporter permease [Anaerolineae bacterium]|nr:iron ABC transporter permease [Anaerolineae bacterium]